MPDGAKITYDKGTKTLAVPDNPPPEAWGLDGTEEFDFFGIEGGPAPSGDISVSVKKGDGGVQNHTVLCRLDSSVDVEYYQNGGILQTVLRSMLQS